jgi:hypothetical protein
MVVLLSREADASGAPLTQEEKETLLRDCKDGSFPEESRLRIGKLIEQILEKEQADPTKADPKNFSRCMEWAGDQRYPHIVALTEEVVTSGGFGEPPLHGRRWIKDRVQLVGCALVAVLVMMLAAVIIELVSGLLGS